MCPDSRGCIPDSWICDGEPDCYSGDDEWGCPCSTGEFTCHNTSSCIPIQWVCDTDNDCGDFSDELDCNDTCSVASDFRYQLMM